MVRYRGAFLLALITVFYGGACVNLTTPLELERDGGGGIRRDGPSQDVTITRDAADSGSVLESLGQACTSATQCNSGFCVDGVCCDGLCTGTCRACNQTNHAGTCTSIPAGDDPAAECTATDPTTCKQDGACDGTGSCRLFVPGTVCAPANCTGSTLVQERTCDGAGQCQNATTTNCSPYTCGATNTCRSSCAGVGDCVAGRACTSGSCGPKPNGTTCTAGTECASTYCVEGVCCGSACTGTCQSCALAGMAGTCVTVPAGQDPRNQCADQMALSCGTDGACDGAGACRRYTVGTVCANAGCVATNSFQAAKVCNSSGACGGALPVACGKYACSMTGCRNSCTTTADCAAPSICSDRHCGGLKGEYFDQLDFSVLKLTRTDGTIDLTWPDNGPPGVASPDPSIDTDTFSIRWTGKITPTTSENFRFFVLSDDRARLTINGVSIVDDFSDHSANEDSGSISLTANQSYDIKLEYGENQEDGRIRLSWSSNSMMKDVVPAAVLTPAP